MIHVFAVEPRLAAMWARLEEFRFIHDKFGLGTPRAMLELPTFTKWKREVHAAASSLPLSEQDMKRLEEIFVLLGEHKCRRPESAYDGLLTWLQNAEREHDRRSFAAILATENPRGHSAVLVGPGFDSRDPRFLCPLGVAPDRTPEAFAGSLSAMLSDAKELHLVDPHFGPENSRHRLVLEALAEVISAQGIAVRLRIHCEGKSKLAFFEESARKMAINLPRGLSVDFTRWAERSGGDILHNRYVLTDLGGVSFGKGLDKGSQGQTDDILLLPRAVYELRWAQYAGANGALELVDNPASVTGSRAARFPRPR